MAKQKSISLNYIMNCILTASSMIFPLISYPYVSRILMPEGMGKVAVANSVVAYFALGAMMGIPTYGIRICAGVRDDKEKLSKAVWELLTINLITTLAVYVIYGICLVAIPRMAQDKALFLIMGSSILFQMVGVEWLYKALEEYSYITIRSVLFKFLALVLMLLCVKNSSDYVIYGGLTMFAGAGSGICNFIRMRRYVMPYGKCRKAALASGGFRYAKHIKSVGIFLAMSAATTIYTNLDTVMLGFMSGDIEAGYYSSAVKIKGVLVSFVIGLGGVLLPRMSYYVQQRQMEEFRKLIKKAAVFVAGVSVPLCVLFMAAAKPCILIISGEAFLPAVPSMRIIMPTLILIGFSNICGMQILVPLGLEKEVLYSEIMGAVTDVCLNLCLIPSMGAAGAAIGTLAAEAAVLSYQVYAVYKVKDQVITDKAE